MARTSAFHAPDRFAYPTPSAMSSWPSPGTAATIGSLPVKQCAPSSSTGGDHVISLTYLSTATRVFDDSALADLLSACREKNHALGLTGMLLYAGGHFIQTLEGEASVVDATYDLIVADPRHRDVSVALREEISARTFPDWSMGFETLTPEEASALPGFNDYLVGGVLSSTSGHELGRAVIFHRVFRDRMR